MIGGAKVGQERNNGVGHIAILEIAASVPRFYFDHNATTPISPVVLEVHTKALAEVFGNASSIHYHGQIARRNLDAARTEVANLLACGKNEVVFGSGGTEANNTALFGVGSEPDAHVITTKIEHPAVLQACTELEQRGVSVTYLDVGSRGEIDPDQVRSALRPETVLVSVMHVNNETGVIQPVREIARVARQAGVLMHCDGVQAAGRIPVDVHDLGVDMYSVSAHKMYAPKGVGALYVREGVPVRPLLFGGRHEGRRRAGTENVAGAIAFGAAANAAAMELEHESERLRTLRDKLERGILQRVPDAVVNGGEAPRVPHTSNIAFSGIEGEAVVIALDLKGFCISSGSACSSGASEPSHVLLAMGLSREQARSSVRFSLGASNDADQVDALIDAVAEVTMRLRHMSPRYAASA